MTIVGGQFNRSTDTFGKMELYIYAKLLAGEHSQEARTSQRSAGKNENALWNERMTFSVPAANLGQQARLYLEVKDSDVTYDDVVASGYVNLLNTGVLTPGAVQTFNVNVFYDRIPVGVLNIQTAYIQ